MVNFFYQTLINDIISNIGGINMEKIFFFSDNTAAVHPTIMQALVDGNKGHGIAYGLDDDAKRVNEMFKALCGRDVDVMYLNGGTGANGAPGTGNFRQRICGRVLHAGSHLRRDDACVCFPFV